MRIERCMICSVKQNEEVYHEIKERYAFAYVVCPSMPKDKLTMYTNPNQAKIV